MGVTAENIADGSISTNINELFKSSMSTLETSCATFGAGTYNIVGNYQNAEAPTGSLDPASLKTTFLLTIQRDNTGYRLSYTDEEGNTNTKLYYDIEREALTQIDKDNIYVGFFASRNAKITVTDINLSTSDPATDPPAEGRDITYISPNYSVISPTATGTADYEMIFNSNADGVLTIKDANNTVILESENVTANTYVKKDITLTKGSNTYTLQFTPDPDFKFSEYEYLSSYDTVTLSHTVTYHDYDRTVLYVSPEGTSGGIGSKENPLDIYTAVKYVKPGQMIVLLGGTYSLSETLVIARGIDGTADKLIYMVADPNSLTRPVFDFNSTCAGMVLAGDYWYLKGFDVTRSADAQKGVQLSGDHCVLDQINTYYNGNTGVQISRYLSTDSYEEWPANNLILNCTSYGNADKGYEDADGFAAKLTVGDGNVFDGCISYNNADDGWDLFAKVETGPIGQVVIKNCVAYGNGYLPDGTNAGNGNGFKLGGSSIAGNHMLVNCVSFNNKAKGIDSNSGPDIMVFNCTTFNNESYNVALYTNDAANTNYFTAGILSYRTEGKTIGENIKEKGSQDTSKIYKTSNYYWYDDSQTSHNTENSMVNESWFVNLDTTTAISRNSDGTINMNGLLALTDSAPTDTGARMAGLASGVIVIPDDDTPTPTPTPVPSSSSSTPASTNSLITLEDDTSIGILLPKDVSGEADWTKSIEMISDKLKEMNEKGQDETGVKNLTISVDMNGVTKVPKELLKTIQGLDTTLRLQLGNGINWTIKGTDIGDKDLTNIDLAVNFDTSKVTEATVNDLLKSDTKDTLTRQISLVHEGDFPFNAELTIDINHMMETLLENNSSNLNEEELIASMYYYNPESGTLTLQSTSSIDKAGNAHFTFTHASDYVLVLGSEITLDDASLGKITVNEIKAGEITDCMLYSDGTVDGSKDLVVSIPDSIKEAVDKELMEYKVSYTSDNKTVAVVSKNGRISAVSPGMATITTQIVLSNKTLVFKTKVTVKKAYIELIKTTPKLKVSEKATFKAAVYGFNKSDIIWMTNKKGVAIVSKNKGKTTAVVTGKSVGTEKLYVKVLRGDGAYEYETVTVTVTGKTKTGTTTETKAANTKQQTYVVKKGDSLWKIAREYNCSLADILSLNNIKDASLIFVGQKLNIPSET